MKFLLLAALIASTCQTGPFPPQPNPDPVPFPPEPYDSGPGPFNTGGSGPEPAMDPGVRRACENLTALQCKEGGAVCYRVLQKVLDEQLTAVPLACITTASTKEAARACGFVKCP